MQVTHRDTSNKRQSNTHTTKWQTFQPYFSHTRVRLASQHPQELAWAITSTGDAIADVPCTFAHFENSQHTNETISHRYGPIPCLCSRRVLNVSHTPGPFQHQSSITRSTHQHPLHTSSNQGYSSQILTDPMLQGRISQETRVEHNKKSIDRIT